MSKRTPRLSSFLHTMVAKNFWGARAVHARGGMWVASGMRESPSCKERKGDRTQSHRSTRGRKGRNRQIRARAACPASEDYIQRIVDAGVLVVGYVSRPLTRHSISGVCAATSRSFVAFKAVGVAAAIHVHVPTHTRRQGEGATNAGETSRLCGRRTCDPPRAAGRRAAAHARGG